MTKQSPRALGARPFDGVRHQQLAEPAALEAVA
jgi:hypothetical protein